MIMTQRMRNKNVETVLLHLSICEEMHACAMAPGCIQWSCTVELPHCVQLHAILANLIQAG